MTIKYMKVPMSFLQDTHFLDDVPYKYIKDYNDEHIIAIKIKEKPIKDTNIYSYEIEFQLHRKNIHDTNKPKWCLKTFKGYANMFKFTYEEITKLDYYGDFEEDDE